ncbi:hypothetical protein IQ07DRAFT_638898 [Pyrenochaeta sp. DS3sAY3a]|nr:hypothetical protein IQ07DRAFT_638898 [Pyrenochaeta sp. DS3sAY3a]
MATVRYAIPSNRDAIREMKIYAIIAVAHQKEEWLQAHTNHWCLYLKTSETTSVRINMIPDGSVRANSDGLKGNLVVSELKYVVSADSVHKSTIRIMDGLNVGHIVDAITEAGREKYEFDEDAVGCRKWTTDTLDLLIEKGLANTSDAEAAKENILKLWPDGTSLPLDEGTYYNQSPALWLSCR